MQQGRLKGIAQTSGFTTPRSRKPGQESKDTDGGDGYHGDDVFGPGSRNAADR